MFRKLIIYIIIFMSSLMTSTAINYCQYNITADAVTYPCSTTANNIVLAYNLSNETYHEAACFDKSDSNSITFYRLNESQFKPVDYKKTYTLGFVGNSPGNDEFMTGTFNFTGNGTQNLIIINGSRYIGVLGWNGSNFTKQDEASTFNFDAGGVASIKATAVKDFPDKNKATLFVRMTGYPLEAYVYNGSTWSNGTNLISGIANHTADSPIAAIYNLSRNNNFTFMIATAGAADLNFFAWRGDHWSNITDIKIPVTIQSNRDLGWTHNFNRTSNNYSIFINNAGTNLAHYNIFYDYANATTQNSTNLTSGFIQGVVNATVNWTPQCPIRNVTIYTNVSGDFIKGELKQFNIDVQKTQSSFNYTNLVQCNQITTAIIEMTDLGNLKRNITLPTTRWGPFLYNNTAREAAFKGMSCLSSQNVTIAYNFSATNEDFTINMSSVFVGENRTCPYGANRVSRIINTNKTSGCTVEVYGANFTQSINITIDIQESMAFGPFFNIPAAIVASTFVTAIIVYVWSRRRR